jgi:hypothetical protein
VRFINLKGIVDKIDQDIRSRDKSKLGRMSKDEYSLFDIGAECQRVEGGHTRVQSSLAFGRLRTKVYLLHSLRSDNRRVTRQSFDQLYEDAPEYIQELDKRVGEFVKWTKSFPKNLVIDSIMVATHDPKGTEDDPSCDDTSCASADIRSYRKSYWDPYGTTETRDTIFKKGSDLSEIFWSEDGSSLLSSRLQKILIDKTSSEVLALKNRANALRQEDKDTRSLDTATKVSITFMCRRRPLTPIVNLRSCLKLFNVRYKKPSLGTTKASKVKRVVFPRRLTSLPEVRKAVRNSGYALIVCSVSVRPRVLRGLKPAARNNSSGGIWTFSLVDHVSSSLYHSILSCICRVSVVYAMTLLCILTWL